MTEMITIGGIRSEVHECITCGIPFGVPVRVIQNQRENGGYHYCPNGHSQGWAKEESEFGRMRRERDRLVQQIAERDDSILSIERERDKAVAEQQRLRTRANAGLCLDCNRSFANLVRHRASKHKHIKLVAS